MVNYLVLWWQNLIFMSTEVCDRSRVLQVNNATSDLWIEFLSLLDKRSRSEHRHGMSMMWVFFTWFMLLDDSHTNFILNKLTSNGLNNLVVLLTK